MGVSRAGARIRVSGEEERGGHGQGAGVAEVADATPQDGGQEHHHQRRRSDSRLTRLMQSPSASAALRAAGAAGSTEGSSPLFLGAWSSAQENTLTPARKRRRRLREVVGEWCGGCRGWGRDGMAVTKGKSSARQWEG